MKATRITHKIYNCVIIKQMENIKIYFGEVSNVFD